MSKILKFLIFCFVVLLLAKPAKADGPDFSIGTGFGFIIQPPYGAGLIHMPITASIGYSFSRYRISAEGLASFPLVCHYALAVVSITFVSNEFVRGYALAGLGYGDNYFFIKRGSSDGDIQGSGPVQAQAGIGVGFKLNNWLELGIDSRARVGFPENPGAVTLTQHVWVMFKL